MAIVQQYEYWMIYLESIARSATGILARAIAIAAHIDLGQFGDSHNGYGGVEGDAESDVLKL